MHKHQLSLSLQETAGNSWQTKRQKKFKLSQAQHCESRRIFCSLDDNDHPTHTLFVSCCLPHSCGEELNWPHGEKERRRDYMNSFIFLFFNMRQKVVKMTTAAECQSLTECWGNSERLKREKWKNDMDGYEKTCVCLIGEVEMNTRDRERARTKVTQVWVWVKKTETETGW